MAWAAWGKARPPTAATLRVRSSTRGVGVVAGAVHHRDRVPWQLGQLGVQRWLIGLDDKQVVGSLGGDEELGVGALGVQRVGGDQDAGKVEAVQQWLEHRNLVGGAGNITLGEHGPVAVVQGCQQMHRGVVSAGGATQALAVHREHPPLPAAWRVAPVGQPSTDGAVQRVGVDPGQHPADRRLAGAMTRAGQRVSAHAQREDVPTAVELRWRPDG
jgi:hypothetical protein